MTADDYALHMPPHIRPEFVRKSGGYSLLTGNNDHLDKEK